MAKDQVAWVSLEDVMAAADRGLAPLGPELAGFVVLEAAARARELGGVVDAAGLAVGTSGHVALTAPPRAGDEAAATLALRKTLSELLAVASATTPALRACAKRREGMSLGMLTRELEAGLIPLNRAASRRGIARMARATLEALTAGELPEEHAPREISEEISEPPARAAASLDVEPTPYAASVYQAIGTPPLALADLPSELEEGDGSEIEIVSHLPPMVVERDHAPGPAPDHAPDHAHDHVAALVEAFEVSRRRDDPALSRDLKAMVGIETSMPPAVTVNVRLREPSVVAASSTARVVIARERSDHADEIPIDHEPLVDEPATHTPLPPKPRRRGSFLGFVGLGVLVGLIAVAAARPSTLDAVFGAAATPPGEDKGTAATSMTAMTAMKPPSTCEAMLIVEGVPAGAEVLRRLGSMPLSVMLPSRAPLDLIATLDGATPRRVHLDAHAAWQSDATGLHLDVPFVLEPSAGFSAAKWPTAATPSPLHTGDTRGLVRATSSPAGATLWITVDPAAIAVPCGGAVDLSVVTGTAQRGLHLEWTSFAGSPPRATAKL